jgi:hypothetical protein
MSLAPNIEGIRLKAASGDAGAQYVLAGLLSQAGRREEAEQWLQASAKAGFGDAIYTLATRRLHTSEGAVEAASMVDEAAAKGSAAAARLRASMRLEGVGFVREDARPIAETIEAARRGEAVALRELGATLLLRDKHDGDALGLLDAAARSDLIACAVLAARAAAGRPVASAVSIEQARLRLKELHYPRAEIFRDAPVTVTGAHAITELDWAGLGGKIADALALRALSAHEMLSSAPAIDVFRNAVPEEICEYLIAHAALRLGPSLVYDPMTGKTMRDPLRTSSTACLALLDLDFVVIAVNRLLASYAGLTHEQGEFLSVLRYAPGQLYRPHLDCIPPGPDFDRNGQRVRTALLYLNDDYEGGETHFLAPDIQFRGARGDVIVFRNVDAALKPDPLSRHAGLAVTRGEKWLASRWFRDRAFRF